MKEKIKQFAWGYIALGIFLIAVGVCLIALREAFDNIAVCIGVITILFGIVYGVRTLMQNRKGFKFAVNMVVTGCVIASGVVTAVFKEPAVTVVINVLCLLLIVDGSFKLHTSILTKRCKSWAWWVMIVLSVAIIVAPFVFIKFGMSSKTMAVVFGVITIVDGLANIFAAFFDQSHLVSAALDEKEKIKQAKKEDKSENDNEAENVGGVDEAVAVADGSDDVDVNSDKKSAKKKKHKKDAEHEEPEQGETAVLTVTEPQEKENAAAAAENEEAGQDKASASAVTESEEV